MKNKKVILYINNIYLFFLIVTNTNLFIYDKLVNLIKERSESKFIISYIYKFKIFKLNSILFYYIY